MAISVDRIHQQYQKENVVDFDFDVVGLVVATMIDGGGSDEESKEFQKLSLTHVPQVPKKESKEFQKLSLTDMPPQPQVPKKKVDDGGEQLEQKPVAARGMVTREEIRRAVWSCGDDKSPGPDGFSFEFFRKYWNFIGPDFCGAVEHFFNKGDVFHKARFAKASDCVPLGLSFGRYEVLFGFGPDWCRWIQGTLSSAKASILVNGSPTAEFSFYRGLKQGDPLSPFLFILIMESLHLSMVRASSNGVRRSVVDQAANKIGCLVMSNRFSYLGVMVGDSMNRRAAWVEVINKLRARLSNWKVKTVIHLRGYFVDILMAITPNADRWVCDLTGDGNFRVKEVRNFLDDLVLPSSTESTRWVKWVPIKTNIFIWKARRDCLPTRFNLSRKGVMLDSILCPLCDHAVETTQHVLFQCAPLWRSVFIRICNRWELVGHGLNFSEWQSWFLSIRMSAGTKNLLDGVFATFWWYMWGFRNRSIFDSSAPRRSVIFDEVVGFVV
ncbi:RNA-directed DNA polymerase, eukaryota [Tanacetum coccineum]